MLKWTKWAHFVSPADRISLYFLSIKILHVFCQREEDLPLFHNNIMLEGLQPDIVTCHIASNGRVPSCPWFPWIPLKFVIFFKAWKLLEFSCFCYNVLELCQWCKWLWFSELYFNINSFYCKHTWISLRYMWCINNFDFILVVERSSLWRGVARRCRAPSSWARVTTREVWRSTATSTRESSTRTAHSWGSTTTTRRTRPWTRQCRGDTRECLGMSTAELHRVGVIGNV